MEFVLRQRRLRKIFFIFIIKEYPMHSNLKDSAPSKHSASSTLAMTNATNGIGPVWEMSSKKRLSITERGNLSG